MENIEINKGELEMVKNEIGFAKQMCATMGNNDSEYARLDSIFEKYESGKLTSEEAISEARSVPENKIQR